MWHRVHYNVLLLLPLLLTNSVTRSSKLQILISEQLGWTDVFDFGERLIDELDVLLDAEHDAENAAARPRPAQAQLPRPS